MALPLSFQNIRQIWHWSVIDYVSKYLSMGVQDILVYQCLFIAGVGNFRPPGCIWPVKPLDPAREVIHEDKQKQPQKYNTNKTPDSDYFFLWDKTDSCHLSVSCSGSVNAARCRASATLAPQDPPFIALSHLVLSESLVYYYVAMFSTEMKDSLPGLTTRGQQFETCDLTRLYPISQKKRSILRVVWW